MTSEVASAAPLVIAVDLGGTKCHGLLAELHGLVVSDDLEDTGNDAYQTMLRCVTRLSAAAGEGGRSVAAVGIGVPAIVAPGSGRVHSGPNVGWSDFELGARLAEDIGLPLVLENDAHLAAIGEARLGAARGVRSFVVVSIGTGIGAAAVVEGRLLTGHHNAAGEIGSMVLDRSGLAMPPLDSHGWFESVAAGPAIASKASLSVGSKGGKADATTKSVFTAMHHGDPQAVRIIDEFLDHLAMALIAVGVVLDPELVVLDGGVGRSLEWAITPLNQRIGRHTPVAQKIVVSSLQPTAALVGATIAAAESTTGGGHPGHRFGTFARSMLLVEQEVMG
jgi:glucokinase